MQDYTPSTEDLDTVYSGPVRVWISGPSIVEPGDPFDIRISLLRADGFADTGFVGELEFAGNTGITGLPGLLSFTEEDRGTRVLHGCSAADEGFHRFSVAPKQGSFPAGRSHPIWSRKSFPYRLYWGDIHVHSILGKCGTPHLPKSPDFGFWYARHVLGHDFCGMSDHATRLTDDDWERMKESVHRWHREGEFTTVLGFEGDYDGEDGGHFNIYFPGEEGPYRSFKREFGGNLGAHFEFAREHGALAVCHHTSRSIRGRDFSISRFGGVEVEPVMEVYSQWGSSELYASTRPTIEGRHPDTAHYYRYALEQGYRLGVIAGSDSHCTTPGGPVPMIYPQLGGKSIFPYPGGLAAVFAPDLSRNSLFEAIRARRCYGTSLEKTLVWLESGNSPMGTEKQAPEAELTIAVSALNRLIEVVIVKNGLEEFRFGDHGLDQGFDEERLTFNLTWRDSNFRRESCYYIRAVSFDGEIAWSSPIWIRPGSRLEI